jgi:hypothetical protein
MATTKPMTRFWSSAPSIQIEISNDQVPCSFSWYHRRHRIVSIQQHWIVDTDWWTEEGRIWREYYAVITDQGLLCVIFLNLLTQSWHLTTIYD